MPRPPLPLGTYGKIKTWQEGTTWLARAKFRDFDGIARLVKRSGKTKAAAERELKTALADRQMPVKWAEITGQTTMDKLAELWLAEIERAVDAGTKSPGTLDTYRSIYRRHVKPAMGALRVREVNTPVVDRVLDATKKKTVSGARTAKIVISGMMRLAARHGAVTINPVREVDRIEGTPRHKPKSLTAEERQQWLDALRASEPARVWDLPDLSLMMLATGCRIGECLAIGWQEIDLDRATVEVCWRLVRRTGVGLLRLPSTKSGQSGERLIPLPNWAMTMLTRRRLAIASDVPPVFPDSLGRLARPLQRPADLAASPRRRRHPGAGQPHVAQDRRQLPRRRRRTHPQDQRPTRTLQGQHDPRSLPRAQTHRPADRRRPRKVARVQRPVSQKCPKSDP